MDREQLYYVLFEQQKDFKKKEDFVPRELTSEVLSRLHLKLPIIITGLRRVGKSTLLKILTEELNLSDKECFYINFNDERLISFTPSDFQKILDFLNEQDYKENCYLFIDEIQEVSKWEKWIDRIKEKYSIIITGSNSKLLSKEISTVLTGRSVNVSLYPFSFKEVLASKNIKLNEIKLDLKLQAQVRKEFLSFLNKGGIPKPVIDDDEKLLVELYENIIYRDIIKRFNPRLEKPIKEISLYLLSNISKEISLRSLSKTIGITNLSTMKSVIDSFEKAFLFFFIHKFDFSLRKQLQNPRKVYCIDNGFTTKVGFRFSDDKGRLLENLVFTELKRRGKEIYYFSEKRECDFVIKEGIRIREAVQVCYQLNNNNKERELNG
ncbi:MAG: ATP-binding protein, partial [Nanoarchaeota archaeon]|nr:ATP-binding protein [Nanoarchaeota archaeon]